MTEANKEGDTPMDTSEGNDPAQVDDNVTTLDSGIPEYAPIEVPPASEPACNFAQGGPRLMITHIVNSNFKSFAGCKTLGPFHKNFSCVVGPNGSGKSNVIDSMLFVFGYRAKRIRCTKISLLIHKSEKHKHIDTCTVGVHFQKIIDTGAGDHDYDVVPDSKFVVSRTASRDGSSYYRINDRKVTYKEVAVILRSNGIDLDHNRFLILQGEVEEIALMKPKAPNEHDDGMLEFLEDIIGSNRLKEPIERLAKRVEDLNEIRGQKLHRVKAVEKEKDDLEGEKNEAIGYLTMENDVIRKKNMMHQKYIAECQENQTKATSKRDEINKAVTELNDKLAQINESKKARNKDHKKIYKEYEALTKKCEETKDNFSEFEQRDVRCREDLKHAKAKSKKLDKVLEEERKKLSELKSIPERSAREVENFKKKLDKLEEEKAQEEEKLKAVMESLKTETAGLQVEKEEKEKTLLGLQKVVNETKSKFDVGQSELDLYLSNQKSEKTKLKTTEQNLETAITTLKERTMAIKELEKKLPDTQKALTKAKHDLERASGAEASAMDQVRKLRLKVEEGRSSLQMAKSRGRVLEGLMSLKHGGQLPGIYGRLGDLGAIDEKYDVAISTACGQLDNILVDTMETAKKCVEFLKNNNVGVATFIALDKMDKWKEYCANKIQTPENVPRLFDLVKVQDKSLLPAFYFTLRDTVVAKDLEQATKIAYGKTRFRVVTLKGELIEQTGTMSGGGTRVCRGKMGNTTIRDVDPKELEGMEVQLQKFTQDGQVCRQNKERLEETVEKLDKCCAEMTHTSKKYQMEIQSLKEQEQNLRRQVDEQVERVKRAAPDEKELSKLRKSLEEYKKEYDKAQAAASKVEQGVQKLHKQIMDISRNKLKTAESRVTLVNDLLDEVAGRMTKANVAVKTAERNTKKCEAKVQSTETEMEENKENIKKLEQEFAKLEADATEILEAYQNAQEQRKEVEAALEEVKEYVAKLEDEDKELQKQRLDVQNELDKYETIVKENHTKIKYWTKELGKLVLNQIEDDQTVNLPTLEPEQLQEVNKEEIQYEITILEEKLGQLRPNMTAIAEYKKKESLYLQRVGELDQVTELRDQQRKQQESLRKQRLDEFMGGLNIITMKLREIYQMITLGGDADLELVDSLDPFSEGILFSVRPPKKSWKNISNLSGGEKTLSSLALVFALHHYKPTPFYVMDEVDAALDFRNVSIIGHFVKERTKDAQFIIISLRNNMFELADHLIGIYKVYDCTDSVTINPKKIRIPLSDVEISAS